MSAGAVPMIVAVALALAALGFLVFSMVASIRQERSPDHSIFREFGLSLSLMTLFFATWFGHGITQWQAFTDEQAAHGQPVALGDFFAEFGRATLENWQSEFLQLFAFVVLAALYIHKSSAESKDSEEKLEASLRRIEEKLGTLPGDAPHAKDQSWRLPDAPMKILG